MKNPLNSAFSKKRLFFALFICLSVSGFLLYSSVSKNEYTETKENGTHKWVDYNNNNRVDYNNPKEFVLKKNGGFIKEPITSVLKKINWGKHSFFWLFAAVCFMLCRDLFYIIRIKFLTKNKLTWKASVYVIILWEFASALTPGVIGGSAVAMFILNRESIPIGKATSIVIITAFMDNLFFLFLVPCVFLFIGGSVLFPESSDLHSFFSWYFWCGFCLIFTVCFLLYLTLFWVPKLATKILLFVFSFPFIRRWKVVAINLGGDIERSAKEFQKESFPFWLKVFAFTFCSWTSRYLVINCIMNAFLILSFNENVVVLGKQLVLWVLMIASPTPGGSGFAELGFAELLSSFTSSTLLLASLAFIWRMISYFPYLFIGSIVLPYWVKRTSN